MLARRAVIGPEEICSRNIHDLVADHGTDKYIQVEIPVAEGIGPAQQQLRLCIAYDVVICFVQRSGSETAVPFYILRYAILVLARILQSKELPDGLALHEYLHGSARLSAAVRLHHQHRVSGKGLAIAHFHELVFIMREVETGGPAEAFVPDDLGIQCQLYSLVAHLPGIGGERAGGIDIGRHRIGEDEIGCLFLIYIHGTGETVLEQAEIEADVRGGGLFPFQVRVLALQKAYSGLIGTVIINVPTWP